MKSSRFSVLLSFSLLIPLTGCDDDSTPQEGGESSGGTTDADTSGTEGTAPTTDPTGNPSSGPTTDPTTDPSGGETSTTGSASDSDGETTDPTSDPSDTETTGATDCEGGVPCEDEMILDLGLVSGTVSAGAVGNTADGGGWITTVDATAGGIVDAPSNPWTYLRFTDDGLEKVELDDLEALTSADWHIAAKRFGLRLNSGSSGPGCVSVATLEGDYADVETVPDDATFRSEAFYDNSCSIIDDGSGAGGANYALTPWWFYPGCVGVTYVPFAIELDDGRHVKFMVDSYYESGQTGCNETGAMGSGSANFTWRWSFLD
ncbi:MAG: HmuY family protein [Nannocystales bacterium]